MVVLFDHYSDQTHTVESFKKGWGDRPWNDMNIPIGLSIYEDIDQYWADFIVFLPRKEHIKHVKIAMKSDEDLQYLRSTMLGIAEVLYGAAASKLENFARSDKPLDRVKTDEEGLVLYYWDTKED